VPDRVKALRPGSAARATGSRPPSGSADPITKTVRRCACRYSRLGNVRPCQSAGAHDGKTRRQLLGQSPIGLPLVEDGRLALSV